MRFTAPRRAPSALPGDEGDYPFLPSDSEDGKRINAQRRLMEPILRNMPLAIKPDPRTMPDDH